MSAKAIARKWLLQISHRTPLSKVKSIMIWFKPLDRTLASSKLKKRKGLHLKLLISKTHYLWTFERCEMRNFKNGRRRNSELLSVYLFKSQCSCATVGLTGLQVCSFIAFLITLQIVLCLVHIIATWNKCQMSINHHAMFPLMVDQCTTFSLKLWRQFIWNTAKGRVVYSIKRALETLCCVL